MSKVISYNLNKLGQFLYPFPIQTVLHILDNTLAEKALDGFRCRRLRNAEAFHELLCLELVGQLAKTLLVAGAAATYHELLVLVGEIVERHLTEEELLAFVLDFHRQTAKPFVIIIHRQCAVLLPLVPVSHQDKRQRDADTIIRNSF